jgi:hypothetical protein
MSYIDSYVKAILLVVCNFLCKLLNPFKNTYICLSFKILMYCRFNFLCSVLLCKKTTVEGTFLMFATDSNENLSVIEALAVDFPTRSFCF